MILTDTTETDSRELNGWLPPCKPYRPGQGQYCLITPLSRTERPKTTHSLRILIHIPKKETSYTFLNYFINISITEYYSTSPGT